MKAIPVNTESNTERIKGILNDTLSEVENNEGNYRSAVVLLLRDNFDEYSFYTAYANLHTSELVALLDVAKASAIKRLIG